MSARRYHSRKASSGRPSWVTLSVFSIATRALASMVPLTELTPFPDVEAIRFAYYNGTSWQSQWNSMLHGGLPNAVRVSATSTQRILK